MENKHEIIHAVVANQRLLTVDHQLDYLRKSHFLSQKFGLISLQNFDNNLRVCFRHQALNCVTVYPLQILVNLFAYFIVLNRYHDFCLILLTLDDDQILNGSDPAFYLHLSWLLVFKTLDLRIL